MIPIVMVIWVCAIKMIFCQTYTVRSTIRYSKLRGPASKGPKPIFLTFVALLGHAALNERLKL